MSDMITQVEAAKMLTGKGALARRFEAHWRAALDGEFFDREYAFHPERGWRFDYAFPEFMVAIEIEGGVWNRGAHVRGKKFIDDCDKYNQAALLGWIVLRFTEDHINKRPDEMIETIVGVLNKRKGE